MRAHLGLVGLALVLLVAGGPTSVAQDKDAKQDVGLQLPPGVDIEFAGKFEQTADGGGRFTGPVTITWADTRVQADRLELREGRYIEAEGNVLIVWGRNRIFGDSMTYDMETDRGVILDAIGHALDDYVFWAKSVEKIGDNDLHLKSATITTCTQPVPYWSFAVTSATITIDQYARMWNVRLRASKVPFFYLPYIVWPVKEDRAIGLLMPEIHTTADRGTMYSQQLFIPIGRSADLTLEGRYYTKAGFAGGGDVRYVPNRSGWLRSQGFYINDQVYAKTQPDGKGDRYQFLYRQEQRFRNGFRMVADIDLISDPNVLSDFRRDLNAAAASQTLARLEFSRNGAWISQNIRELRREQLSSGLVQQTLPEFEWRGRNRRLGRTPFYLAFEASMASIQQKQPTLPGQEPFNPDYLRGDVFPQFSLPWAPRSWVDITPRVSYRATYWTQQQQLTLDGDRIVVDDPLTRGLLAYGVEMTVPKLYRIYGGKHPGAAAYKHTIETRVRYGFAESFAEADDVLVYDEVDRVSGADTQVTYVLVQRLLARRARSRPTVLLDAAEMIQFPDGTVAQTPAEVYEEVEKAEEREEGGAPPPAEPVEIASFEIGQTRSFDNPISRADLDGDGIQETTSFASPVLLTGRYNPTDAISLDLRGQYDILFNDLSSVTVSGGIRAALARLRFSLVHRNGLGFTTGTDGPEEIEDQTQVRVTAAVTLLAGRLNLRVDGSYNANPTPGTSHFPEQRWQFQYSTQCCTVFVERLTRDFAGSPTRRDLSFRVDLRGVGKILSSTF